MEFFLEVVLQIGLELLMIWSDDRFGYFPKIPRKVRALGLYVSVAFILGSLSSLVASSPLLVPSLNPWLSLVAVPCVVSVLIACLCGWLDKRGVLQTELRHFTVSLVVAFVFASSRYLCLKASLD